MKSLESSSTKKSSSGGKGDGIQPSQFHSRKIHLSALSREGQVTGPQKGVHMEIDDNGFAVNAECFLAGLDYRRLGCKGGFGIIKEESEQQDRE